jgi:hypothetical protein
MMIESRSRQWFTKYPYMMVIISYCKKVKGFSMTVSGSKSSCGLKVILSSRSIGEEKDQQMDEGMWEQKSR